MPGNRPCSTVELASRVTPPGPPGRPPICCLSGAQATTCCAFLAFLPFFAPACPFFAPDFCPLLRLLASHHHHTAVVHACHPTMQHCRIGFQSDSPRPSRPAPKSGFRVASVYICYRPFPMKYATKLGGQQKKSATKNGVFKLL